MKKAKTERIRLIPYPVLLFLRLRFRIRQLEDKLFEAIYSIFVDPYGDDDEWF